MASLNSSYVQRGIDFITEDVTPFMQSFIHKVDPKLTVLYLLGAVFLQLRELTASLRFGATKFDVTPVALVANAVAVRILPRDTQGRIREVSIWVDSASGGPTPTIRVFSQGGGNSASGGLRINAGQGNELGKVPPEAELFMASNATITAYVIERA